MARLVDLRRCIPAWLALVASVGVSALVQMVTLQVLSGPPEGTADITPFMVLFLAIFACFWGGVAGLVTIPFRRLVMGPRFPFMRRGYAVLALVPLVVFVSPSHPATNTYMFVMGQIFFLLILLNFAWIGRLFLAFDPDEIEGIDVKR